MLSLVFLEVWRLRTRARLVDGDLRPWILSIANNVMRNQLRTQRRYDAALRRYHEQYQPPSSEADTIEQQVVAADQMATVRAGVQRLSRKLRAVAELCVLAELTPNEAAAILRLPESTVRSRLAAVRQRLQGLLHASESVDTTNRPGHRLSEHRPGVSATASKESVA